MSQIVVQSLADTVQVAYSGKKHGNTGTKFSTAVSAIKAKNALYANFPGKKVVMMDTDGQDTITNLDGMVLPEAPDWVKGDAFITTRKDLAMSLSTADCPPVVLYVPSNPVLALLHVGTHAAALHLPRQTIAELSEEYDVDPNNLHAYVGPAISKESYIFTEYPEHKKLDASWKAYSEEIDGRWHIDLLGYILDELRQSGITDDRIETSGIDTGGHRHFYSHRRSKLTGEPEGRNGFVISLM